MLTLEYFPPAGLSHAGVKTPSGTFEECVVLVSMSSNFSSFSRRGPDSVTEELVAALSDSKLYEFKALFVVVHAGLRARNAASGGEEMLRLRAYEKLQNLVQQGQVKKTGKRSQGYTQSPSRSFKGSESHPGEWPVIYSKAGCRSGQAAPRTEPKEKGRVSKWWRDECLSQPCLAVGEEKHRRTSTNPIGYLSDSPLRLTSRLA